MGGLHPLQVLPHYPQVDPLLDAEVVLDERVSSAVQREQEPDVVEPGGRSEVALALRAGRADGFCYIKPRREVPGTLLMFLRSTRALVEPGL